MKPILTAVTDLEPTDGSGRTQPRTHPTPELQRAELARVCGASGLGGLHDEPRGPAVEELAASDIE